MLRRLWILIGICLISFNSWFYWIRTESSSLYFFYGEQYDTSTGVAQYYLYNSDGELLFPIEGANYAGDFPFFDLMWSPTGQYFFKADAVTNNVSVLDLDGKQRQLIEDVSYADFYNIEQGLAPDKKSFALVFIDDEHIPSIAIFSIQGELLHKIDLPQPNFSAPNVFWSPDGVWIYAQLCEWMNGENTCGLYRVRSDASDWTILSQAIIPEDAENFTWLPDGKTLIFINENMLMLVATDSDSNAYRAHIPEILYRDSLNSKATRFTWSPDSQWVVYQKDGNTLKRLSASADSPSETILNATQTINLLWCDNQWVYYWAYELENTIVADFYRVPLAGGSPQLIFPNGIKGKNWDYNTPLIVDEDWLIIAQQTEDNPLTFYRLRPDGTHQERIFDSVTIRPNSTSQNLVYQLSPDKRRVLIGSRDYTWEISYQFKIGGSEAIDFRDYSNPQVYESIYMDPSPVISMPYRGWGIILGGLAPVVGVFISFIQRQLRRA